MICTEQERDALMAAVIVYGNQCRNQFDAMVKGDGEGEQRYNSLAGDQIDRIRALLAPPDDAVVRELIAKAVWDADRGYATSIPWPPASEFRKGQAERIADAIIAVLRGEATRDE